MLKRSIQQNKIKLSDEPEIVYGSNQTIDSRKANSNYRQKF